MTNVIALTGHPASGKTTLAKSIEDFYGVHRVSGSSILKNAATKISEDIRPQLMSRNDFDQFHRAWRKENSIDAMGKHVIELSHSMPDQIVCFENLRNIHDAEYITKNGGVIIALQCSFQERHKRALLRDPDQVLTAQQFLEEESSEYDSDDQFGSHVERVIKKAQMYLDTSKDVKEVLNDVREQLKQVGILL